MPYKKFKNHKHNSKVLNDFIKNSIEKGNGYLCFTFDVLSGDFHILTDIQDEKTLDRIRYFSSLAVDNLKEDIKKNE